MRGFDYKAAATASEVALIAPLAIFNMNKVYVFEDVFQEHELMQYWAVLLQKSRISCKLLTVVKYPLPSQ